MTFKHSTRQTVYASAIITDQIGSIRVDYVVIKFSGKNISRQYYTRSTEQNRLTAIALGMQIIKNVN